MKILHIIPSYLPAKLASGPILPTHNLNKELVKNGIEVVVYTTNLDGDKILNVPLNKEVDIDGVKVFYFPITFPIIFKRWQYSWRMHRALASGLKNNLENFDLAHITSVFLSVSTLGAYYAKKFCKPYIISAHGTLMSEPLNRGSLKKKIYLSLIEKNNLAGAVGIHFLNEREKEDYLAARLPLKKAVVIPNSLQIGQIEKHEIAKDYFRKKFNIAPDKKIVLFLARLHPIKGLDTLIPAFAEVVKKEPNAVLVLAGPDEEGYKKEVEIMVQDQKFNIKDKVIFTGMILGDEKISAMRNSSVFVLPSYTEALSMSIIEAMLFSLPIVTTENVGNAADVLKANAGFVVEKNTQEVADAILKILSNSEMAKKMGENGRLLVEQEFSSGKVAQKWIKEYKKLINEEN